MQTYKAFDDFIDGMRGGGTTDNWDVVVSYSLQELDAQLAKLWTANGPTANVVVTTLQSDPWGNTFHIDWYVIFSIHSRRILNHFIGIFSWVRPRWLSPLMEELGSQCRLRALTKFANRTLRLANSFQRS